MAEQNPGIPTAKLPTGGNSAIFRFVSLFAFPGGSTKSTKCTCKTFLPGGSSVIFRLVTLFLFERGGGFGSPWALPGSFERGRKGAWYQAWNCWVCLKNAVFSCVSISISPGLAQARGSHADKWSPPDTNHEYTPGAVIFEEPRGHLAIAVKSHDFSSNRSALAQAIFA